MIGLRAGGRWLHALGAVGDLQWSTQWTRSGGGGLLSVSWSMSLPDGFTHPSLRQGVTVELFAGGWPLGKAVLAEPNRDEWTFVADGLFRSGEHFVAVDGTGLASTNIQTIVTQAISRGLPWRDPGGLPNTSLSSLSEGTSQLNFVSDVLNRYCELNNKRWWIDRFGYLRIGDDPTAVSWALTPGTPSMATADDDYASRVYVRRVSAVSGTTPTAWAANTAVDTAAANRWGTRETIEDLTNLGLMTSTAGDNAAAAILAAGRARPQYSQGVEITPGRLTNLGGVKPELWQVEAGQLNRHFGWLDSDGNLAMGATNNWVIGSTNLNWATKSLTISPLGIAPRTQAAIQQANTTGSEFS